jgi:K+-transporting ATPase ATPase A chain
MTLNSILQISLYLIALLACVKPLGLFMARVYDGRVPTFGSLLSPIERLTYRLCGINKDTSMTWQQYTQAVLSLSVISFVSVYAMQRMQALLPLNPDQLASVSADSSFNTAISFVTNTNWQGYGGETTMSYLTQMVALTVQNFISAAAGMAVLVALIRGFTRSNTTLIGNFWVDLVRGTLYILLPLSVLLAVALVSQGVVQTFRRSANLTKSRCWNHRSMTKGTP